jgi:hypothetical protein
MKNRLFIICPFSNLESFINKKYGKSVYFISNPGAVTLFKELDYLVAIKKFLEEKEIDSIYIANDLSCPFIDKVIHLSSDLSYSWEKAMDKIYNENYFENFCDKSNREQKLQLATFNINNLAKEIIDSEIFKETISARKIFIRGLVTDRINNAIEEINIHHFNRNSYEF